MKRHPFEHPLKAAPLPPHPDVRHRKTTSLYALGGMEMIKMSPLWAITLDIVTSTVITGGTAISAIMIHGQSVNMPTPAAWFSIGVGSVVSAAAIVRAHLALPPAEASH